MQGAYHVVENALGDVVLDDRHMLVGRRMVDGIDLPGTHHVHQAFGIAHRTEDRQQVHRKRLALDPTLQFLMDAVGLYSLCSNRISTLGEQLMICRQSSEPIEPPAPVTITT